MKKQKNDAAFHKRCQFIWILFWRCAIGGGYFYFFKIEGVIRSSESFFRLTDDVKSKYQRKARNFNGYTRCNQEM